MKILTIFIAALFTFHLSSAQIFSLNDTTQDTSSYISSDKNVKNEQRVQRGSLKGPQAKNHPDWRFRSSKISVAHPNAVQRKQGPEAKNHKVWKDTTRKVSVVKKEKRDLKGPRAKNYKPWKNR